MDIQMPDMNGLDAARELRKKDTSVVLVFVTNLAQMAVKGYEVDAVDFVIKPIDKYAFALKAERIFSRVTSNRDEKILITTERGDKVPLSISTILYVEKDEHYLILHTLDKEYMVYGTLNEIKSRLPFSFSFSSRSDLVNFAFVKSIRKDTLLIGKDEVPLSHSRRNAFLESYTKWLGGEQHG